VAEVYVEDGVQIFNIGGLVGYSDGSNIQNSYAMGRINIDFADTTDYQYIGGLVGWLDIDDADNSALSNSFSTGSVDVPDPGYSGSISDIGGLMGKKSDDAVITQSYHEYESGVKNDGLNDYGTQKTAEELKALATYSDPSWSIRNAGESTDKTWVIYEGLTTPMLSDFMTKLTIYAADSGSPKYGTIAPSFWHPSEFVDTTKIAGAGAGRYSSQLYYDIKLDNRDLILDNGVMSFGNANSETASINSFSSAGLLLQPFFNDDGTYKKLTYSTYPMDFIFGVNGDGTNEWNDNGNVLQTIDGTGSITNVSYDTSSYNFNTKTGTIAVKSKVTIGGTELLMTNSYQLEADKSLIAVTTTFKNIDDTEAQNVRLWAGTRDDYLITDRPVKVRGNMDVLTSAFTPTTATADRAKAIKVTNPSDDTIAIYMYSEAEKSNSILLSGYLNYASRMIETDPSTSSLTLSGDDTYSMYFRFADLAVGASDSITWYYAGGKVSAISGGGATPPPPPPVSTPTPDVSHIVNGTAVNPPIIVMPQALTPQPAQPQSFSFGGEQFQLLGTPIADIPTQLVGMQEVRGMMGGVSDIRIPLGQNSLIQLVNGGVRLPNGIEQEFFMARN